MVDYIYDIESYPNFFSCVFKNTLTGRRHIFEVSERHNNAAAFHTFFNQLAAQGDRMVGYNNCGYDYQVIHHLMMIGPTFTAANAYEKTYQIIHGDRDANFQMTIWPYSYFVPQIDLFKLHHFDNFARSTSLKVLEFNMRSGNIGDLPYPPGENIPLDGCQTVINYNCQDVDETEKFYHYSKDKIEFRESLGVDINWNDTKIGKKHFENQLEKVTPGITGTSSNPRQTVRQTIDLNEAILPEIIFHDPSLNSVVDYLRTCVLTETKAPEELKDVSATINNFTIHFGAGGGHGSVARQHVKSGAGFALLDVDVTSYYPSLAIKNKFYPAHLSETFCDIYEGLFAERKTHAKKTAPNEMLKLALNGVYGDSANKYSPFFDQLFTMKITLNGQLLLAKLVDLIACDVAVKLIQFNTDGVTMLVPDEDIDLFEDICSDWEVDTGLNLEQAEYSDMWIKDVNNYIARYEDGKMKRIGCYAYETARENPATREVGWHKNHSALVVKKAAEAAMVHGTPPETFIKGHQDAFDFFLRGKVPGGSRLRLGDDTPLQKVTRYYIAKEGKPLWKTMPPLPRKGPDAPERTFAVNKGWDVAICDDLADFDPNNINFDWYITEAKKIIIASSRSMVVDGGHSRSCRVCGKDTLVNPFDGGCHC